MTNQKLTQASTGFGLAVTSTVLSSFDQKILAHVTQGSIVYDIGAGEGALALACANKGARVHAVDLSASPEREEFIWHQKDIRTIDCTDPQWEAADILIFRRVLYYFSYEEAGEILQNFKTLLKKNGKIFCSLIGVHSPYAETGYPRETSILDRFAIADNPVARQYNLLHPVCMYTEDEARNLFVEAGLSVVDLGCSKWSVYITAV